MWRTKPTTVITWRTKPTTVFDCPRCSGPFTCDTTGTTCDSILFTCDITLIPWWLETSWATTRYAKYVEDLTWANITDLFWNLVVWISWNRVNKIDTILT